MNKFYFYLVACIFFTFCTTDRRRDATSVGEGGWAGEGWAGPPIIRKDGKTPRDTRPRDWYYMKWMGRASDTAIKSRDQNRMKNSCGENTKKEAALDVLNKLYGPTISQSLEIFDLDQYKIDGFQFNEKRGIVYFDQPSGKLTTLSLTGTIAQRVGLGIYDCLSMGPGTVRSDPQKENWEYCECSIYAKYEGGRDAYIAKAKSL
jgi:hypothetical protein